jgi:hypothetical protein
MFYDTTKADWKLFQEKLPNWQENFMKKLNNEYIQLLTAQKNDSEKFWELERRIKTDRRKKGVICEMRKNIMVDNIISLINEDAITFDDLSDFSDELKEYVSFLLKHRNFEEE